MRFASLPGKWNNLHNWENVDENKILRSKGRIENSDFPWSTCNPIYLPPSSKSTHLIVYEPT